MEEDVFLEEETAITQRSSVAGQTTTSPRFMAGRVFAQELAIRQRLDTSNANTEVQLTKRDFSQYASIEGRDEKAPSPYQMLSAADVDPFATMPVDLPPHMMALLMDQTRAILLRQVTNRYTNASIALNAAGQMMQMTVQNQALFYSMIAASMRFFRVSRHETHIPQLEVAVEARSIELLSQQMASLDTALTETNIVAIVACGYCGRVYPMRRGRLPRQSSLRELQDLNVYGRMVVVEAHVLGLSKLIPLLGGLYALKTPGLAQLISFCDLFDCTRKIQQPLVPFVPHTEGFRKHFRSTVLATANVSPSSDLQMAGLGFGTAFHAASSQEVLNLIEVLLQFADFTIFMDNFLEGRFVLDDPVELTDLRNYSQHQLMSLQPSKSLIAAGRPGIEAQYESCRLACISYSLLVVFPLPPTVGLFEKLVRRLRAETANLSTIQEGFNTEQRKLHFWILAMATISSIGLPERQYFLSQLDVQAENLGIVDGMMFIEILKHFLWHPSTNNKDGLQLWKDILEARRDGG